MILDYDPVKNLQHYPLPMSRYGTNPYGDPLYRIVFTESRRQLVSAGPLGESGYCWRPKYPHVTAGWILERWRPELSTKAQWENSMVDPFNGFPVLGPYPSRGDYELVWEFSAGVDSDNLDTIIQAAERKFLQRYEDTRLAMKAEYEAEEKAQRAESRDEVTDCLRFRNDAPLSYGRFGRGSKTAPNLLTAEQAGVPIPRRTRRIPRDLRGIDFTSTLMTRGNHHATN